MKDNDYIRVIVSDVHLGSAHSKEDDFFSFIKETYFDELIINGDFLDLIKCPDFSSRTLDIINYLIETKKKIIYIIGNHDNPIYNFKNLKFCNVEFKTKYSFDYCNRKYFITHGDNYDSGLVKYSSFMKLVSVIQNFLEKTFSIDLGTFWAKIINKKNMIKSFWDIVNSNINSDVVIIGHLHKPEVLIWVDENSVVKTYANTGDWVFNKTYIEVRDGVLRLKRYKGKQLDS